LPSYFCVGGQGGESKRSGEEPVRRYEYLRREHMVVSGSKVADEKRMEKWGQYGGERAQLNLESLLQGLRTEHYLPKRKNATLGR